MMKALLGAATLALGLGLGAPSIACELDRPLKMAGLDYDSAAFHTCLLYTSLSAQSLHDLEARKQPLSLIHI